MTQQLEHSWVKDIFTPEELKQYAAFESEWKNNSTVELKAEFEKKWAKFFKCKYAVAVNSGTSAQHAALIACGVK